MPAPRLYIEPNPSLALPAELRERGRTGDLLLYSGRGLFSWLTRTAGRTRYSHAGMLVRGEDLNERVPEWYVAEMTFRAPGIRTLASVVAKQPGRWEWRPMAEEYRRRIDVLRAAKAMRFLTQLPYGRWGLIRTALTHTPVARWFTRPDLTDGRQTCRTHKASACGIFSEPQWNIAQLVRRPPFCSAAVSIACRRGGLDPVPNLADDYTEPADLARSLMWERGLRL